MRNPLLDPPSWAPAWLPTIDDVSRIRAVRWVVFAVLAAGLGACVLRGADSPEDPELLGPPTTSSATTGTGDGAGAGGLSEQAASLLATFGSAVAQLVSSTGDVVQLCLLRADTLSERGQGLMGVEDLGGFDGMVFVNDVDSEGAFYMFGTPQPLTVGWFAADGAYVGAADMEPCLVDDPATCERFPPPAPYRFGLEVFQGDPIAAQYFTAGAALSVGTESCTPPA